MVLHCSMLRCGSNRTWFYVVVLQVRGHGSLLCYVVVLCYVKLWLYIVLCCVVVLCRGSPGTVTWFYVMLC